MAMITLTGKKMAVCLLLSFITHGVLILELLLAKHVIFILRRPQPYLLVIIDW